MSTTKSQSSEAYENNPFHIGLKGLNLLFNNALSVAILGLVLIGVGVLSQFADVALRAGSGEWTMTQQQLDRRESKATAEVQQFFANADTPEYVVLALLIATVAFLAISVNLLIYGIFEYTAARLSEGKMVNLGEAALAALKQLASLLWLATVVIVKVLLWSLLLIVPGIIMAVRYSLSGTVFFREGLRGNAATKRSAEITKGAWFTTFAGQSLWNLMTFGTIQTLLTPGTNAVLYRQLAPLTDANKAKPAAHWLSWVTFFVPIALVVFILLIVSVFVIVLAVNSAP